MSTVTATAPGTFDQETHHKKNTWAKVLPIIEGFPCSVSVRLVVQRFVNIV